MGFLPEKKYRLIRRGEVNPEKLDKIIEILGIPSVKAGDVQYLTVDIHLKGPPGTKKGKKGKK